MKGSFKKSISAFTKKIFCSVLISAMLICGGISAFAETPQSTIDEFLASRGMPDNIIEQLPEKQKELIYSTLSEGATFESYEKTEYYSENSENSGAMPLSGNILSSEMTMAVVAFEDSYEDGLYTIYPSFVWNGTKIVANDTFAMAMYPGWEVVAGENNLTLWCRDANGDLVYDYDIGAQSSSAYGYSYKIPRNIGFTLAGYEGYSYLDAIKKSSSATNAICLKYIDDTTSSCNVSYSVTINSGSISVSGTDTYLRFKSGNFSF